MVIHTISQKITFFKIEQLSQQIISAKTEIKQDLFSVTNSNTVCNLHQQQ